MKNTSFNDCHRELVMNATAYGRAQYERWRQRPGYSKVVEFVSTFTHRHLYKLSLSDVQNAIKASQHALGNVRSEEQLKIVENFSTPFAFQHLFHWYIESERKIPTWKEFRDWMVAGPAAVHWYLPLKRYLEANGKSYTRDQWSRAAKWRLGKVYMSNIRELHLLTSLSNAGLPVQYHLLADVLLRVDFWCETVLVCVYFPNSLYRAGAAGRKPPASDFFDAEAGRYDIVHFGIERQGFGNIWLATNDSCSGLAAQIRNKIVSLHT